MNDLGPTSHEIDLLLRLAVALGAGLLIGLERGWHGRGTLEGSRIAGIRTFALIALAGALLSIVAGARPSDEAILLLGAGLLAVAGLFAIAYWRRVRASQDLGITTGIAAIIAYALGAAAGFGELEATAAVAVVVALILGLKPKLHAMLEHLEERELLAIIKLLLISVVVLPVLPDQGYGPWEALNPYRIWWMVVLIAGISFVGYFAVRLLGERQGILLTGAAGGLAASTPTVLALAHRGQGAARERQVLAGAALLACAISLVRILVVVVLVAPVLTAAVVEPLLAAAAAIGGVAVLAIRGYRPAVRDEERTEDVLGSKPFEMRIALQFGFLLVAIMLVSSAMRQWFGDLGLYAVGGISGLVDVDAITLSMASQSYDGKVAPQIATSVILIAAAVNTAVKAMLAIVFCRRTYGVWVLSGLLAGLCAGGAVFLGLQGI